MFVCNNPMAAEKEVAEWLASNPVTIDHITQSQSERGGAFVFVLSLFYTRKATALSSFVDTGAQMVSV